MATISETPRGRVLTESNRRVQDPLRRLRGYIRSYVITESLLVLVTFLAVCFWVGTLIDYGMFRLFGIDFVNDLPRWFRALLLGTGLLAVFFFAEGIKALRTQARPELVGDRGGEGLVVKIFSTPALLAAVSAPIVILYIAAWIWLANLVDADIVSNLVVGLFVLALVVAFISFVVVKRLVYELRPTALALVLERRFPDLLEDRLITAVELSDPKRAAEYGYSEAMVEETIHQAAQRVDQIHLGEVFRWSRLALWGITAVLLTFVAYGLAGGGAMAVDALNDKEASAGTSFTELNHVASIWFERNVLLDNEPWPGGVMIVRPVGVLLKERKGRKLVEQHRFVLFPDSGEVKVGKGGEVTVQALAYEFALYDRNAPGRWRPVRLDDLRTKTLDVGDVPAAADLPRDWVPLNDAFGLTIEDARYHALKSGGKIKDRIAEIAGKLRELAKDPARGRTFRRLKQPKKVSLYSAEGDKETFGEMDEKAGGLYEHKIPKFTATMNFKIRADDYINPQELRLLMVPPPRMADIDYQPSVPAYLYHLPEVKGVTMPAVAAGVLAQVGASPFVTPLATAASLPPERPYDDDQFFLAPRKQLLVRGHVNVAGVSRPEVNVPIGSDITLVARCDKPLSTKADDVVFYRSDSEKAEKPEPIDDYRFRVKLTNVRQPIELTFEFTDTDGDSGKQVLAIMPNADETPQIKQFQPEVVRTVEDKLYVTPSAVIPFKIVASDDNGLTVVEYVYSIQEAATQSVEIRRAVSVAGTIGMIVGGPEAPLTSLVSNLALPASLKRSDETITGTQPIAHFKAEFDKLRQRTPEEIDKGLSVPMLKDSAVKGIRNYILKDLRDLDSYLTDAERDLDKSKPFKGLNVGDIQRREGNLLLPLKAPEGSLQKNYLMLVTLQVRDTNVNRPGRGNRLSSQQYAFLIVSDNELLFQISLEEQRLFDELKKTFDDLERARSQLSALRFDIPAQPGARGVDFVGFSVRAEEIDKVVRESLRVTTKVHADYEKILREMRTNRIHEGDKRQLVERVKDNIVGPMAKAKDDDFPYAQSACTNLRRTLDNPSLADLDRLEKSRGAADAAEKEMDRVLNSLREILVHMAGIVEINKLIAKIRELEQRELNSLETIKARKDKIENEIFEQLGTPKKDEKDKKDK
ncbi:MAG: hypothetical protein HYS12_09930 [Planctomycetes bacterium]|nr:hypothetical protein [Planctomycetota bacterium]